MKRKTSNLDFETYEDYIDSCYKEGVEEVGLYSTGEPFMTKNLDQYIQLAKNKGIKRLYISTNGSLATLDKVKRCIEAGLDSIKFSINAGTKATIKLYMVMMILKRLKILKKFIIIKLQIKLI